MVLIGHDDVTDTRKGRSAKNEHGGASVQDMKQVRWEPGEMQDPLTPSRKPREENSA